jgi:Mg-chelatase subunit ChlD
VLQQRQLLLDKIAGLKPLSATQLYTSLIALYKDKLAHYQQGKRNRIVVLTDGPNDDGLSVAQLKTELTKLKQAGKDISISIIAIGPQPERGPLAEIAQSTGGSLSVADDGKAIDAALAQLLSAA